MANWPQGAASMENLTLFSYNLSLINASCITHATSLQSSQKTSLATMTWMVSTSTHKKIGKNEDIMKRIVRAPTTRHVSIVAELYIFALFLSSQVV